LLSVRRQPDRIQARAIQRCGELLKQFDAQGKRTDKLAEGNHHKLTKKEVATQAGLSEHQTKQAARETGMPS
jgi:hypothetical protein